MREKVHLQLNNADKKIKELFKVSESVGKVSESVGITPDFLRHIT